MPVKPKWLNKKIDIRKCQSVGNLLKDLNLSTICQNALCPNISECFSKKRATFLILGNICTRGCGFCGVKTGKPEKIDFSEPKRISKAVEILGLRHVVITSVTRDDLDDGGADVFVITINQIKKDNPNVKIEVLVPDFLGNKDSIDKVVSAKPDIFGHNIETVRRLYPMVRNKANYKKSLDLLKQVKDIDETIYTKSSIMLGLGEEKKEVLEVFSDLRKTSCDFISIGQYLAPSLDSYPVKNYIEPREFDWYKTQAQSLGFKYVSSGPYVRSSYLADNYINQY